MKPVTQDILHEMISFSHNWDWDLTLLAYKEELESEDLWSCFDMKIMREIFTNTTNEEHRMRACDYIIKNGMPVNKMINLLCDFGGVIETDAGMHMLVHISFLFHKVRNIDKLLQLFYCIFSPTDKKYTLFCTKIAKEIARRKKPGPLPPPTTE